MKFFSKTIFKNTCSVSLSAGWPRSGWSPRTSRNTWSQRASRKHRQRWATGPPRRAGETLAFYLTWSLVPVSLLSSLILQLLCLIYESHCADNPCSEDQVQLLTKLNPVLSVGFRHTAFPSTLAFLADAPKSKWLGLKYAQIVQDRTWGLLKYLTTNLSNINSDACF